MTLIDWIEIQEALQDTTLSDSDRVCSMLSIYLNKSFDEVEEMPVKEIMRHNEKLRNYLESVSVPKESEYGLPFRKLTLGNFIDIETYLTDYRTFPKVAAILLFRKTKKDKWDNIEHEPVTFDLDFRAGVLESSSCESIVPYIYKYLDFRNTIINEYKAIFGIGEDDIEEEPNTEEMNKAELAEYQREQQRKQNLSRYSWESFVYWLSGERVVDVEKVLEFPVIYALNMASMRKVYES